MAMEVTIEEVNPDGTRRIISPDSDEAKKGYHNFLVMFNAIVDLDYAVLRMIQAEYNNPQYIDQSVMNMTEKQVRYALLNRNHENPLNLCIKNKDISDNIYKEIMSTRYGDLLKEDKYLSITGIFFLLSVYETMENTHITIVCGNVLEKEIVRRYHKHVNVIIPDALSDIDVNSYTDFIFKSWKDVLKLSKQYNEKRILLLNYKFNTTYFDKTYYPRAELAFWLWNTGYSNLGLIETYSRNEPDYVTLGKRVKKKSKNK